MVAWLNRVKKKKIFTYATLILFLLPTLWVLWFMLMAVLMPLDELTNTIAPALSKTGDIYAFWPLLPSWPTLQPLMELLLDTPEFFVMFWNSFALATASVLGQFLVGAPAAWALAQFSFKAKKFLMPMYIVVMLLPFQVTMIPNYLVINKLGIMDTLWAVILPFAFSAFPVFIMMRSFSAVPKSVLESASIDGAGHFKAFAYIGLPLGLPGILSALVLGFLDVWNAIEQPQLFLKDPSKWPLALYLPAISQERLGVSAAASLLMLMPALLIFLLGQQYLEMGIQTAGLKE